MGSPGIRALFISAAALALVLGGLACGRLLEGLMDSGGGSGPSGPNLVLERKPLGDIQDMAVLPGGGMAILDFMGNVEIRRGADRRWIEPPREHAMDNHWRPRLEATGDGSIYQRVNNWIWNEEGDYWSRVDDLLFESKGDLWLPLPFNLPRGGAGWLGGAQDTLWLLRDMGEFQACIDGERRTVHDFEEVLSASSFCLSGDRSTVLVHGTWPPWIRCGGRWRELPPVITGAIAGPGSSVYTRDWIGQYFRLEGDRFEAIGAPPDWFGYSWCSSGATLMLYAERDVPDPYARAWLWDGASWSSISLRPNLPWMENSQSLVVSGDGAGGFWFGGDTGSLSHLLADGSWDVLEIEPGRWIEAIAEREGVWWVVGESGLTLRKVEDSPWVDMNGVSNRFFLDLAIDGEGRPWTVDYSARLYRWSGTGWEVEETTFGGAWSTLWTDETGRVWAAGDSEFLARRDPQGWKGVNIGLDGLWVCGGQFGDRQALAGPFGRIAIAENGDWTEIMPQPGINFRDLAFDDAGRLYVVGDPGALWWDGNGGELLVFERGYYPGGLAFDGVGEMWIVGDAGLIVNWSGGIQEPREHEMGKAAFTDIVRGADGSLRIVDERGAIYHRRPADRRP